LRSRSGKHHDFGLLGVETPGGAIDLYRLAWLLGTIDELAAARQTLLDAGAYTGKSSHGTTKSVYDADATPIIWVGWCCSGSEALAELVAIGFDILTFRKTPLAPKSRCTLSSYGVSAVTRPG
jgi:hypothetical protein